MPEQVYVLIFQFLARRIRFFQWAFLTLFYSSVVSAQLAFIGLGTELGSADLTGSGLLLAVPLIVCILLANLAYQQDKRRDAEGLDDFRDEWLFFRYGKEVNYSTISIPVKAQWGFKETQISAETLRTCVAERIATRLPSEAVQVIVRKPIADIQSGEQKEFTRISVRSAFGSTVTMFVHYAAFGQTITAHYFTYLRGTYGPWSLARFVLASPFTIWFWGIPWLLNRHSIIARISELRNSSFDTIDLQTMYGVAHRVVFEETATALQEVGLWTEEIQQVINNNIQQVINLQSLAVINSPGAVMTGNEVSSDQSISARGPVPVTSRPA